MFASGKIDCVNVAERQLTMDAVGSDIVTRASTVQCRRFAQKTNRTFTRIVRRQLRFPNKSFDGGNVDDRFALGCDHFFHAPDTVFDTQEGSGGVDCHAAFPVFQRKVFEDLVADTDAGRVEEDVNGTDSGFDSVNTETKA